MVDKLSYSAPPKLPLLPPIGGATGRSGGGGDRVGGNGSDDNGGGGDRRWRPGRKGRDAGADWWQISSGHSGRNTVSRSQSHSNQLTHRRQSEGGRRDNYPLSKVSPYDSGCQSLYGFLPSKPVGKQGYMANALFHAVQTCRFSRVKVLIDQGLRPRVKDASGRNLLMACLEVEDDQKRTRMFHYLLRRGADPHYVDTTTGRDVVTWAVVLDRHEQVHQLLDSTVGDIDLQRADNDGYTALHHAALQGSVEMTRMLVGTMQRYHLPVDMYDRQGLTPYIHARRLGHHDISCVLLKQGQASPRQADRHSFRGPDEWEAEGVQERYRKLREHRMQEQIHRKISGRFLPTVAPDADGKRTSVPRIFVSSETGNSDRVTGSSRMVEQDEVDGRRRRSQRYKLYVPEPASSRKFSDPIGQQRESREPKGSTLNLMEDAAILRNTGDAANLSEFKSSEFDDTKQSEYKAISVDVTAFMTSLSEQQSSSFRKTVIPPPPAPKKVPVVEAPPKKEKVSTLAILMGKGQGKGGKNKKRAPKAGSDKKKKSESRKKTLLPRI